MHGLFNTTDPEGARAFLRDKIGLSCSDVGGGWLIFDLAEADLGCHPAERGGQHFVSFYCDDLDVTMAGAAARGVKFSAVVEEEWGRVTTFELPGGGPVQLYQPKYAKA